MTQEKSSKNKVFTIVKWIFSISFLMATFGALKDKAFIFALCIFLMGLLLLPPLKEFWRAKIPILGNRLVKGAVLVILFFIMGTDIPETKESSKVDDYENNQIEKEDEDRKENEVRLINLDMVYYDMDGNKIQPDDNDITYRVVEVLEHTKNEAPNKKFNFENLHLLIESSNYSEEALKAIAFQIKDKYAKFAPNNCNIDLWDNKKAYQLYTEREKFISETFNKLMDESQRTGVPIADKLEKSKKKWDKKNYTFMADHLPASITLGNDFWFYMLQDDYYKEMGGKNLKK